MDFLGEVRKRLDIPPAEREQVMKELEDHYSELREELQADGMNECEAATEAARRLGDPGEIAGEIQTVHCRAGWKTAFITAVPLILALLISVPTTFNPYHLSKNGWFAFSALSNFVLFLILAYPSLREWRADRRPIWLATWIPSALSSLNVAVGRGLLLLAFTGSEITKVVDSLPILTWGLIALLLLRDHPKWRAKIVLTTIVVIGLNILMARLLAGTTEHNVPSYLFPLKIVISGILYLTIPTIIAIGLFGRHRLGGVSSASLFMFTLCSPLLAIWPADHRWMAFIPAILCILAVVVFARQGSAHKKLLSLAAGLFAVSIFNTAVQVVGGFAMMTGTFGSLPSIGATLLAQLLFTILIPTAFSYRPCREMPTLVK